MSTNTTNSYQSFDAIKEAHHLSYETSKLENYYDKWSSNYNHDVVDEDYSGPEYIADYLADILQNKLKLNEGRRQRAEGRRIN